MHAGCPSPIVVGGGEGFGIGHERLVDRAPTRVIAVGLHLVREIPMRILALAILAIATVSAMSSARAQTYDPKYPVCLKVIHMCGGEHFECAYASLAQCALSASGLSAQCIVNPHHTGATRRPEERDWRHSRVH